MTFIGCSHRSSNVSVHRRRTISLKSFLCFRYPISFFLFFFFFFSFFFFFFFLSLRLSVARSEKRATYLAWTLVTFLVTFCYRFQSDLMLHCMYVHTLFYKV